MMDGPHVRTSLAVVVFHRAEAHPHTCAHSSHCAGQHHGQGGWLSTPDFRIGCRDSPWPVVIQEVTCASGVVNAVFDCLRIEPPNCEVDVRVVGSAKVWDSRISSNLPVRQVVHKSFEVEGLGFANLGH